jgi:hypothetical protein
MQMVSSLLEKKYSKAIRDASILEKYATFLRILIKQKNLLGR